MNGIGVCSLPNAAHMQAAFLLLITQFIDWAYDTVYKNPLKGRVRMDFAHQRLNEYSVQQACPPTGCPVPNRQYGRVLLVDYAGEISESTAFAQFRCQGALLAQSFPELSEVLYGIAAVDAVHMEMLERLIAALGVKPRMRTLHTGRAKFWSARFVQCGEDVL
ncbi:MAG: hypothetical protein ACOYJC_00775 [Christensenellales bacterium]|jgi:hypothetical protein